MIDLLAIAQFALPALGGAAALSNAGAIATGLTKAALTGLTAYEGAKMIPYFTNHEDVLRDLATNKKRDPMTGNMNLNWLDRLRAGGANLGGLNDDGKITNEELQEYLIGVQRNAKLTEQAEKIADAEFGVRLKDAETPKHVKDERKANIDFLDAQTKGIGSNFELNKTKTLGDISRAAAEIELARQQGIDANQVALERLGLEEQAMLINSAERERVRADDRRQAIFMALMALMN